VERRTQNLTPLQRHLLTLLSKARQGHVQAWLSIERDRVSVEPTVQVLRGHAAVVAAKGLRTMAWLRARPGGGYELALPMVAVALALDDKARRETRAGRDLEDVIERAVTACLTFTSLAMRTVVPQV
jgi:hypothetical protein